MGFRKIYSFRGVYQNKRGELSKDYLKNRFRLSAQHALFPYRERSPDKDGI